ncbi:MAG TPA: VWA domain-containing protein [Pyrinomonadaceae bacterium]|nr:VWA domain-containing protein [Pyrinomonadaceae bacterium]
MLERATRSKLLRSALCLLLLAPSAARAQTQTPGQSLEPRPKPAFGSSLERLKWDAGQKRAVEVAPAPAKDGGGGVEEDEVVRVETSLVVCDVLVLDAKGKAVAGLKREDFLIIEDGRPQEVGAFALGDSANVARSIVLVIDYSGSMRPFLENSIEAAKTLVDKLSPRDRMAVVTDDVELLADFTRDKRLLKEKLEWLLRKATSNESGYPTRFGRSRQYSALMATLRELFDEEDTRPIVIFQTDGDELGALHDSPLPPPVPPGVSPEAYRAALERSQRAFSIADVFREAERSRATIYTVIPGVRLIGLKPGEEQAKTKELRRELEKYRAPGSTYLPARDLWLEETIRRTAPQQTALYGLSKLTGGWTNFLEEPSQAAGIYASIFSDIGRRYVVGFYPTNRERDGKRRHVQIEVRGHPEYTVWGRKSYYAPGP